MPAADRTTPQTVKKKLRRKPGKSSGSGGGPQGTGRITTPRAPKPAPAPRAPSPRAVRNARSQQAQYVSQGKAVKKAAKQQRKYGPHIGPPKMLGGDVKSQADRSRAAAYVATEWPKGAKFYDPTTKKYGPIPKGNVIPPDVNYKQSKQDVQLAETAKIAPALKVLDQTTRPLHGIAAGTKAAIEGKSVGKAALRGIENKDKSTVSDVLTAAGWKPKGGLGKLAKGAVSFTGDVLGDPTTYVTGGTASIAEKAAANAAKKAAKDAIEQGLTKKATQKAVSHAARSTYTAAKEGKGVTVKFAGKEIPGVRRATGAAGRGGGKALRRVVPERTRNAVRSAAADVNPNIAPVGTTRAEHEAATRAIRAARAKTNQGIHRAQQHAAAIRSKVGEKNYQAVIDAIEHDRASTLSPELRDAALQISSHFRAAHEAEQAAGIKGGERANYVPHQLTDKAIADEGKKKARGVGSKTVRPSSSMARKEQRPLSELRTAEPGRYSEDLASLFGHRMMQSHEAVAKAELNRRLADLGQKVKKGMELPNGAGTHAVFEIKGSDIGAAITDKATLQKLADEGPKGGEFVVLNKDVVKRATEGVSPKLRGSGLVSLYDKGQAGFKRVATATPGFHIRNFTGDVQNAYLGQAAHRIPGNMRDAGKVLKAVGRNDKALRKFEQPAASGQTIKTSRYGTVTVEEAAKKLTEAGAARTGYMARDIPEVARSGRSIGKPHVPAGLKRLALNREDLPRLTTAIHALKHGATWEEAAQRVADIHFDYQHLTEFERQIARRFAPFYTFTARNVPLQAKMLVTKPGKYANYEKLREEAQKSSGVDQQTKQVTGLFDQLKQAGVKVPASWVRNLSEWEQRNAGIPVNWGGHKFTISLGLPLTDLNELPGAAGSAQASEYFQKLTSVISPIIKDPVEYFSNYSFFFRDQIQNSQSPNVAAPSYVAAFPDKVKRDMGVVKIFDKKTGKKVWGWPAKVDYIAKAVPGLPSLSQQFATQGTDRRGRNTAGKVLGAAGVKSVPVDSLKAVANLAFQRQAEINDKMSGLRQQPNPKNGVKISAANPTPEYTRLNQQLKIAQRVAYQAEQASNTKILPSTGGPRKLRRRPGGLIGPGVGSGLTGVGTGTLVP